MANINLYPPTIEPYSPAFIVDNTMQGVNGNGTCDIYFSLSKLSAVPITDIVALHISVVRQDTGKSVIYKVDDSYYKRYRSSGILLYNTSMEDLYDEATGLYKFTLTGNDIKDNGAYHTSQGWAQSGIYKIQIRLSTIKYDPSTQTSQADWLNRYASNFSEWSAFCIVKSIPEPEITCSFMEDSYIHNYNITTLEYNGTYKNKDLDETLYSYKFELYSNGQLIEKTSELYAIDSVDKNTLHYLFKTELKNNQQYNLVLNYTTKNLYRGTKRYFYRVISELGPDPSFLPMTIENNKTLDTTKFNEEEDGRVCLKLIPDNETTTFTGKIYIKRASEKDNFTTWDDVFLLDCSTQVLIKDLPKLFDYTIESGIWYKYAVQTITYDEKGKEIRSNLRYDADNYVIREFEYSYLLGENNTQLRLMFDHAVTDIKYNISDSITKTIGSKYPFIFRTSKNNFKQFPLNGLISFHMDEANTFFTEEELYHYDKIIELHRERRIKDNKIFTDTILERDFREKVVKFLQDGKPKLFKSPTQGNIIIKINDVSIAPNKTLSGTIASFSATAYEIAEATIDNYKKYNFIEWEE